MPELTAASAADISLIGRDLLSRVNLNDDSFVRFSYLKTPSISVRTEAASMLNETLRVTSGGQTIS